MNSKTCSILGIPVQNLSMKEAVEEVMALVEKGREEGKAKYVATVNADFLVNAQKGEERGEELIEFLRTSDLNTIDGMPLLWISKLLGFSIKERVSGADLFRHVIKRAEEKGLRVFLLGGPPGLAERTGCFLKKVHPNLQIAGSACPEIRLCEESQKDQELIQNIHESQADLLFVGLGNPKQELWFRRVKHLLKVPVTMGVGGTFAFVTGDLPRAPESWQRWGFEWLYRLLQEPKRLFRRYTKDFVKLAYFTIPLFVHDCYSKWKTKQNPLFSGSISSQDPLIHHIQLPSTVQEQDLLELKNTVQATPLLKVPVLDFTHVKRLDICSIGYLMRLMQEQELKGRPLYLVGIDKGFKRSLKLHRVWDFFEPSHFRTRAAVAERLCRTSQGRKKEAMRADYAGMC